MNERANRRQAQRNMIPAFILCVLIGVAVLALSACSQTPSMEPGGTVEIARTMDFYFLQGWGEGRNGQLRPEYILIPADSEDAQALLTGVAWEVDDCMSISESQVEIPSSNPKIKWTHSISRDMKTRYIVDGLRIEAQATLTAGEGCAPGDYPIVLRMPALGIAAEFLDAGVYFPGKNAPEKFTAPDTVLVTIVQVK
jgi:hypothetical protein